MISARFPTLKQLLGDSPYPLQTFLLTPYQDDGCDLLCFYTKVIRPVLEYACSPWHSSLTAAQSRALESIQRRVMRIIYDDDDDYVLLLILAGLDTLESRCAQLTERFFKRSVLPESSCV